MYQKKKRRKKEMIKLSGHVLSSLSCKHAIPSSPSISLKMRMSQPNIVERNSSWYELYRNASSFPFPPLNILSSTIPILMLTYFQWIVDADFHYIHAYKVTRTIFEIFEMMINTINTKIQRFKNIIKFILRLLLIPHPSSLLSQKIVK